jgi:hypothetical protein
LVISMVSTRACASSTSADALLEKQAAIQAEAE